MNTCILVISIVALPLLAWTFPALWKLFRSYPWNRCSLADLLVLPLVGMYVLMLLAGASLFRSIEWLEWIVGRVGGKHNPSMNSRQHPSYP